MRFLGVVLETEISTGHTIQLSWPKTPFLPASVGESKDLVFNPERLVMRVPPEETEEASESSPFPDPRDDRIPFAVESDLFFCGMAGSVLPGSSSLKRR